MTRQTRQKSRDATPKKANDSDDFEFDSAAVLSDDEPEAKPINHNKNAKQPIKTNVKKVQLSQQSHVSGGSVLPQSQFSSKSPMRKRMFSQIT